jgi:hypothetical protein
MAESHWRSAVLGGLVIASAVVMPAFAQKAGGILQMLDFASPASMSIHEESTITAGIPMMGVFNNLVVFDRHVPHVFDRAGPGERLVVGRGQNRTDLSPAPGRQMA